MDKDFLIRLTNALYRLTLLFPKKEPLRYKMREVADDILAHSNEEDFEVLNRFFEVAKAQSWVSVVELLALQKEYDNLKGEFKKAKIEEDKTEVKAQLSLSNPLLGRQERILTILKEKGRAQVWEIKQIFPDVSKRTLRRDFEFLLKQGIIERFGEKNDTFYQVKVS